MTAQDNERKYSPEVIRTVPRNFYVDDALKRVPCTGQAVQLTSDLTELLKERGFRLTKFASNSREVLQSIPPELRENPLLDLDLDQLPLERALGVYWDAQSGTFKFKALGFNKFRNRTSQNGKMVGGDTTCHHHWHPKVLQDSVNCSASQLR